MVAEELIPRDPLAITILQSSAAAVVKSREVQCGEGMQCILHSICILYMYTLLAGVVEGSLKGIGTPWLSQYTGQLFQRLSRVSEHENKIPFSFE